MTFNACTVEAPFALCVLRSFIHILLVPALIITHSVVDNCLSSLDVEVQRMKKAVESLMAANEEKVHLISCDSLCAESSSSKNLLWINLSLTLQDRKIDDLKQSLLRYKKVQEMVMSVQGKKGELSARVN